MAREPRIIPKIFCKIKTGNFPKNEAVIFEVIKISTVKVITTKIGKTFVYKFKKLKEKFSEIRIDSVMADGPIIKGIVIGKIINAIKKSSLIFLSTSFSFLFDLFSNSISKAIIKRKMPPAIWNEAIEIPIISNNAFPNTTKKISKKSDIKNIVIPSLKILSIGIFDEREAKIGIKAIGSIATNIFTKFWRKSSCINSITFE